MLRSMRVELFLWKPLCIPHHLHHIDGRGRRSGLGMLLGVSDDDGGSPACDDRSDQGRRSSDDDCLAHLLSPVLEATQFWACRMAAIADPLPGNHPLDEKPALYPE